MALLERLAARTRPELALEAVDADLDVLTIHRDASMYQTIPEGTWTLCFGWFMHPLFRMRYGFPLHDALRPLFVSFHCNKRDLLTDDAIAYLRRYGPVGCRDWTTVYLLLSAGVPAFFSGCLTTTVSTTFPPLDERPSDDAPVGYVDVADDRAVRCADVRPLGPGRAPSLLPGELRRRRRPAGVLPAGPLRRGHEPSARLPAAAVAGRPRRVQAGEPLRHPFRRAGRHHRHRVRRDAARPARAAAGGLRTDPLGRSGGPGLRPLARADRRQGRRGGGPAARRRRAGRSAGRPRRSPRDRARQDGHRARERARRCRGDGALRRVRDQTGGRPPGPARPVTGGRDGPAAPRVGARPPQGRAAASRPRRRLPGCHVQLGADRRARPGAAPAAAGPQHGGPARPPRAAAGGGTGRRAASCQPRRG